jgi:hypothetical protein
MAENELILSGEGLYIQRFWDFLSHIGFWCCLLLRSFGLVWSVGSYTTYELD